MKKAATAFLALVLVFTAACQKEQDVSKENDPSVPVTEPVEIDEPTNNENIEPESPDEEESENLGGEQTLLTMSHEELVTYMEDKYGDRKPTVFGENIEGVYTHIDTEEKIVALTFDACGGANDSGYDEELISYLIKEKVPATLFINSRWIRENPENFRILAQQELFDIENHGYDHKPLSVEGQSVYGITGTTSIRGVLDEVMNNQNEIFHITGKKPQYFRSGTAYYDDVSISILNDLGIKAINFDILGDAGASFSKEQMIRSARNVNSGSILLYHMNHPQKEIAEGIKQVIPMLREMGYTFVKVSEYDEYLK